MRFCGAIVALAALLAVPARGENPPTGWVADARTGCKIRDAVPDPDETATWSGACAGGMAEGRGTLQFFVGGTAAARYEGDMRAGRADGQGLHVLPDGTRYEGGWRGGVADGFGVLTTAGGQRHEGTWSNGCLKAGRQAFAVGVAPRSCGAAESQP